MGRMTFRQLIGLFASVLTIFVFVTGYFTINDFFDSGKKKTTETEVEIKRKDEKQKVDRSTEKNSENEEPSKSQRKVKESQKENFKDKPSKVEYTFDSVPVNYDYKAISQDEKKRLRNRVK